MIARKAHREVSRPVGRVHRTRFAPLATATITVLALMLVTTPATAATAPSADSTGTGTVTNLAHLDFLLDSVPLKSNVPGHETFDQAAAPTAEALWVYANRNDDGTFTRVGGGDVTDTARGYYGQGAFDADDIARAAVVYVRDWHQTKSIDSKQHAYGLLRDLTYLQTSSGPNAGNVVLWQQSDGTLNPSPTPSDSPDPSDSANSFWLARTIWALGEAYPVFRETDPAFGAFLLDRLHLAIDALNRGTLADYGTWQRVNGATVPGWLISGSTGGSAEALLGLTAAYTAEPNDPAVRTAAFQLAKGVAGMASGDAQHWPFGAFLSSTTSRSVWNAWAGLAPAALSNAGVVFHRADWQHTAQTATAQFAAQVLASGGPDNGWTPTPFDTTQIAYGVDSLVESLVTVGDNTGDTGMLSLAAIAAGWFFGANPANTPTYDPATGVCVDGISASAVVNRNCGAESTIHTDLALLVLDAHRDARAIAVGLTSRSTVDGITTVEAESGHRTGGARILTPAQAWTGSANWSGGAYVDAPLWSTVSVDVTTSRPSNVYPVVNQPASPAGWTLWTALGNRRSPSLLGVTTNGSAGPQGIAPTASVLRPLSLARTIGPGTTTVTAVVLGSIQLDALLVQPVISHLRVDGPRGRDLYVSATTRPAVERLVLRNTATAQQFDDRGHLVSTVALPEGAVEVAVAPGGFTVVATG